MRQHRPLSRGHELFEGIHQPPGRGAVADGVGFDAEAMAFQMTHGLGGDGRIIPLGAEKNSPLVVEPPLWKI